MTAPRRFPVPVLLVGVLAGCTTDPSFLFPAPIEGVPGVQQLGTIEPLQPSRRPSISDPAVLEPFFLRQTLLDNVIYGEVGPTGSSKIPGVTFEVLGTGGPLCVWVDPELLFWNQSVAPSRRNPLYREPDNIYDDGDIDLLAGQSVFYTGSPGRDIGSFEVRYTDPLGNTIPVDFVECNGRIGRGSPEVCSIPNSLPGVRYTIVLEVWSGPIDDARLGYGMLVTASACDLVVSGESAANALGTPRNLGNPPQVTLPGDECVITGEAIVPGIPGGELAAELGLPARTWLGDEVTSWDRSIEFESAFCSGDLVSQTLGEGEVGPLVAFCRDERRRVEENGSFCSWTEDATLEGNGERCYCGDPLTAPLTGGIR